MQSGKIAGAEIATEGLQGHPGQAVAERDPEDAAEQPDQGAFSEQPADQRRALQAEGAQEGEFAAPFDDRQGLCRKDQEGAGEQGDGGQHGEIDAIGAGQVARLFAGGFRRFELNTGRQRGRYTAAQAFRRAAVGDDQIDP